MIRRHERGFSIIELMIVVGIMGILVNLASAQFQGFLARSKRSEARTILAKIWDAQKLYLERNQRYAGNFDELGFSLEGKQNNHAGFLRGDTYTFYLAQPSGPRSFVATAEGNLDQDPWVDTLLVGETL